MNIELALNISWTVLSALAACFWLRYRPSGGKDWRIQLLALGMLIVVLFPVVSVSDDLFVAQNPALTEFSSFRKHIFSGSPSTLLASIGLPVSTGWNFGFQFRGFATPSWDAFSARGACKRVAIKNRPPPAA
jgi:hypothetical protein